MPSMAYCGEGRGRDTRKPWRYPGVPIPLRLQHRYKVTHAPKTRR
jgi:hypothetical protein